MSSHSLPQTASQPTGLFVPKALLLDTRLKPAERNAWMVLHSLANDNGVATVSHESLRDALLCAPGSQRAASATVSRIVLCLRLAAWIDQIGCRRDPRTGFSLASAYTVRTAPLSFVEACLGSEDYLPLFERGLEHAHASVRQLARKILEQAMCHPDDLARLPSALQEEVKRLHQQAQAPKNPKDGSGDGGGLPGQSSGQHISATHSTFPKYPPEIPETVRTVKNNVCKYSPSRTETPKLDALARFRRLDADQQDYLSSRLQALPVEQRQDVLAEWSVRCAAGTVRDAAAYLFGLIRKALNGMFRLWAARKGARRERPAPDIQKAPRETPKIQKAPREIPKPQSKPGMPVTKAAEKPASEKPVSKEVALAYLQHMKSLLQGAANTASIHAPMARKPPQARQSQRPIVRAVAQAMSPMGQARPIAAFLAPVMETDR